MFNVCKINFQALKATRKIYVLAVFCPYDHLTRFRIRYISPVHTRPSCFHFTTSPVTAVVSAFVLLWETNYFLFSLSQIEQKIVHSVFECGAGNGRILTAYRVCWSNTNEQSKSSFEYYDICMYSTFHVHVHIHVVFFVKI